MPRTDQLPKGPIMRRLILIVASLAACLAVFAVPASSAASPWVRNCSNRDGTITTNDGVWEVDHWHVGMSAQTAGYLGRHYVGEFDTHEPQRQVPCFVGEWTATDDLKAWERSGSSATVEVSIIGSGEEKVGKFRCKSVNAKAPGAREMCFHKPRGKVGAITVRFRIKVDQ
jgi:hypothetical protein